jgi:tetratricopeptide (TPR) repeat protein
MRFLGEVRQQLYGRADPDALSLFRHAIELDLTFPPYWANYGRAAVAAGAVEAQKFLDALEHAPRETINDHVLAIRALALQLTGQAAEASQIRMDKISSRSPDPTFYVDEAKWQLSQQGDAEKALEILEKAMLIASADEYVHNLYDSCLRALEARADASTIRRRLIEAGSRTALLFSAEILWTLENVDAQHAMEILSEAHRRGVRSQSLVDLETRIAKK